MTNFVSTYNFMDLLKDKGVVPQTDVNSYDLVSMFNKLVDRLSSKIELPVIRYNFMDLLHDNGFVPEPCNDNHPRIRAA